MMAEPKETPRPDQTDMAYHMPFLETMAAHSGVVLEIGCGHGNGSTRAFTRGLRRSAHRLHHVIVDIDPERPEEMPLNDLYAVTKVTGDSRDPRVANTAARALADFYPDIIFIDTVHTYEQLAAELEVWRPLACKDTLWVFHDTWMFGSYNTMTNAIKEFCERYPEWHFIDHTRQSHGLGLMCGRASDRA